MIEVHVKFDGNGIPRLEGGDGSRLEVSGATINAAAYKGIATKPLRKKVRAARGELVIIVGGEKP